MSLAQFAGQSSSRPTPDLLARGNDEKAEALAEELAGIINQAANRAPRSQQVHLGPSEIGSACDREIAFKLTAQPDTNHVGGDKWNATIGTAVHSWLEDVFGKAGPKGWWLPELPVIPDPDHPGTADLFAVHHKTVIDWKVLGPSTLGPIRDGNLSRKYFVQLLLYGRGYKNLGVDVEAVALAGLPRGGSLRDMYVYRIPLDATTEAITDHVLLTELPRRKAYAAQLQAGQIRLEDIPKTPGKDCFFCPAYRPQPDAGIMGCQGSNGP